MNYSTEIKFNNDLIKKGKTTITYSGNLFKNESEAVTLVYGFGDNWEHTTEKEMIKNENDFSVEIELLDYDKINFCFRNSDNVWDNNNYQNYIAPILEPEKEHNFIINENLINEILTESFKLDLSTYNDANDSQVKAIESQTSDSTIELIENSIVSEESFVVEIPEEKPVDIQEFIVDSIEEPSLTTDLDSLFSSLFEEPENVKKEEIVNFDIDSLIDEILSPILEAKSSETQNNGTNLKLEELDVDENIFEAFEENQDSSIEESLIEDLASTETSLVEVKESEPSLLVSARTLGKFYILKKKIKLAIYKFFTAIPKIIEASFNEGKN